IDLDGPARDEGGLLVGRRNPHVFDSRYGPRSAAQADLCHYFAPGRGEDHADGEAAALRQCDRSSGSGEGEEESALGHFGLDGAGTAARNLDYLHGPTVRLPRLSGESTR